MKFLAIGSIVKLKKGEHLLMITSRLPLYNNEGNIGYFEYLACLYPEGFSEKESFFFNHDDIEEILFEGFESSQENDFQKHIEEVLPSIKYPRLTIL
ncbi:DUF4176 domain-containing protein [Enterococcus rivorum]|uniref:DUF4176 domain-containing protein n=1 Tax=Enterococcus rivorum TaxID=762845 RepID=A0A1E5KUE1_9ENTE|nr:DUF4176 domain-containing protein [Enterococcus rivorum]MBP2099838.1 hypothetical protein [Enterococcus rivorum]OEH81507.1 hypothetical protein BCR26_04500 [Enterococcus rivorum]